MIIKTRYRDLEFDEIRSCVSPILNCEDGRTDWAKRRGRDVNIQTPPLDPKHCVLYFECHGPFYAIAGSPALVVPDGTTARRAACIHMLEIGD